MADLGYGGHVAGGAVALVLRVREADSDSLFSLLAP